MLDWKAVGVTLLVIAVGYLLGSINSAVIVSRLVAKDDVRNHGSGNAGMTNILRTYGKGPAVLTGLGDFLKGVLAVLLGRLIFQWFDVSYLDAGYIAGVAALAGHLFPLYFGFRGGKGVLTSLGVLVVLNPFAFLMLIVIFVPFVFIVKIVSLASILGAASLPIITYFQMRYLQQPPWPDTLMMAVFSLVVIYMHRENIKRLLTGTESRFGKKRDSDQK